MLQKTLFLSLFILQALQSQFTLAKELSPTFDLGASLWGSATLRKPGDNWLKGLNVSRVELNGDYHESQKWNVYLSLSSHRFESGQFLKVREAYLQYALDESEDKEKSNFLRFGYQKTPYHDDIHHDFLSNAYLFPSLYSGSDQKSYDGGLLFAIRQLSQAQISLFVSNGAEGIEKSGGSDTGLNYSVFLKSQFSAFALRAQYTFKTAYSYGSQIPDEHLGVAGLSFQNDSLKILSEVAFNHYVESTFASYNYLYYNFFVEYGSQDGTSFFTNIFGGDENVRQDTLGTAKVYLEFGVKQHFDSMTVCDLRYGHYLDHPNGSKRLIFDFAWNY